MRYSICVCVCIIFHSSFLLVFVCSQRDTFGVVVWISFLSSLSIRIGLHRTEIMATHTHTHTPVTFYMPLHCSNQWWSSSFKKWSLTELYALLYWLNSREKITERTERKENENFIANCHSMYAFVLRSTLELENIYQVLFVVALLILFGWIYLLLWRRRW